MNGINLEFYHSGIVPGVIVISHSLIDCGFLTEFVTSVINNVTSCRIYFLELQTE